MELKLLLRLLRRWAWLLLLGVALGAGGGYLASQYQDPIYQSTTKVMVIKPQESSVTADVTLNDQELIQTYITLLTTQPVLQAASEQLGFPVSAGQVTAQRSSGTQLLEVTVRAGERERAPQIANTLVEALITQNRALQSSRFASSEESLQVQLDQVESQINEIQADLSGEEIEDAQAQRQALDEEVTALRTEVIQLRQEINELTETGLTAAQRERLLEKQVELAQLNFTLSVERSAYTSRLNLNPNLRDEEVESQITQLQEEALRLEQEIAALQQPEELSEETKATLAGKEAELAQKEFALGLAEQRYMTLLTTGRATDPEGETVSREQQQTTLSLYQQLYANLRSTYESVRLARLQNTPDLTQVEAATVPDDPIQPRPLQNILLGGAVGLIVMGAIAFVIEYLDDTVKTPADISGVFGLPVIGFIADTIANGQGEEKGAAVVNQPRSPVAEAFRALRTNLEFAGVDQPLRTILVTSPGPADGKTTVVTNLAASIAQSGSRVLILDSDLRRPRVHKLLELSNDRGVSDLFRREATLDEVVQDWPGLDGLEVVTSSSLPPNPTELLGSERMDQILAAAQERADVVILDSPPFVVSDPAVLSAKVDGVILVLQPGQTSVETVQGMLEQLRRANAQVLGVVLNRISRRSGLYGGYHYYYYAPYYNSNEYYLEEPGRNGQYGAGNGEPSRWERMVRRMRGGR